MTAAHQLDDTPDFWTWSLAAYKKRGVADMLLEMQDQYGLSVNLLLWCIWAGKYYCELEDEAVLRILTDTEEWQQRVLHPLRQTRRDLKSAPFPLPGQAQEALRRRIKTLELDAERMEQDYLAALTRRFAGPQRHGRGTNAWNHNLHLYSQTVVRLENRPGLGVDDHTANVRRLYLRVLKLLFPEEVVYL